MRRIFIYPDLLTSTSDLPITGSSCFAYFDKYCDEPTEAELSNPGILLKTPTDLSRYKRLRDSIKVNYCDTDHEHNVIVNDVLYNHQDDWKVVRYCILQTCLACMAIYPQHYRKGNKSDRIDWSAKRGYVRLSIPAEVCDIHILQQYQGLKESCRVTFQQPDPDSGVQDDLYPVVTDVINDGKTRRTTWLFLRHHCHSGLFHKVIEEPNIKQI